ncbi:MAG: GldG family protein [Candidatus Omnitrophica bacterium]|nr:GldG family protein [Candidatus Omnitrophota bacterium]
MALMTMWRRFLASGNFLLTVVLIGVLFIMGNYLSSRHYARWDLTRQQFTALSDQTRQTLTQLEEPLSIIVFYQSSHRLYPLIKDLLAEYERVSPKVQVEYVDPEQDIARAQQLVNEFQIDVNSPDAFHLVIFKSGSRHKYISDTDLADYDYAAMTMQGEPRVKAFKGEAAFTSSILSVTQAEQPLLWFTSGHGEKSTAAADTAGLSELTRYLEQQNIRVEAVNLLQHTEIPSDVKLVVIAGPTRRFTEQELALLQTALEQGGRLLALIDPLADTGLDGLLEEWGIALGMDIVVDPARQLPFVSAANLFVTDYTEHPITEKMKTLMTLFPLARSVRPTQPAPEGMTVTSLALTSDTGWGESKTSVGVFEFDAGEDLKGPVSIAAAAERGSAADGGAPTRLVVIGDSEFLIDAQLSNVGNRDFLLGAVFWLIEQEQRIGIGPKTIEALKLNLTGTQLSNFLWLSLLAMPLACGGLGIGMWWRRRR